MKSSLISIMTTKSFSETLFLIAIFLHLRLGKVLGVPRVIMTFARTQYKKVVEKLYI